MSKTKWFAAKLKKAKGQIYSIVILSILSLILLFYNGYNNQNDLSLSKNYKFTSGRLIEVNMPGRSGGYFKFQYIINEKIYSNDYSPGSRKGLRQFESISPYNWVVAYDCTDHKNSTILMQLSDYKKYKIPYEGQLIVDFEKLIIVDSNGVVEKLDAIQDAIIPDKP